MKNANSNARHVAMVGLLVIAMLFPIATWLTSSNQVATVEPTIISENENPTPEFSASDSGNMPAGFEFDVQATNALSETFYVDSSLPSEVAAAQIDDEKSGLSLIVSLHPCLPWLVGLWMIGVLLCSLRPFFGWVMLRRLKTKGVSAVSPNIKAIVSQVAKRMKLKQTIEVFESTLAQVPMVVGYISSGYQSEWRVHNPRTSRRQIYDSVG